MAQGQGLSQLGRYQIAPRMTRPNAFVLDSQAGDVADLDSDPEGEPPVNPFERGR